MKFEENLNRFELLDHLLVHKVATSTDFLAKKLQLSPRQVRYLLDIMRQKGAPVKYCRKTRRYMYEDGGHLNVKFEYVPGGDIN